MNNQMTEKEYRRMRASLFETNRETHENAKKYRKMMGIPEKDNEKQQVPKR